MNVDNARREEHSPRRSTYTKYGARLIRVVLALLVSLVIIQFELDFLDFFGYDLAVRGTPSPPFSGHIELVSIVPSTVKQLNRIPEIKDHTIFLQNLKKSSPQIILYLIKPNELQGTDKEKAEFVEATSQFEHFYVTTDEVTLRDEKSPLTLPPPFESIKVISAPKTVDKGVFAKDGGTRRLGLTYQDQVLGHLEIARLYNPELNDKAKIRGVWTFLDSEQIFIHFHPKSSYVPIPFENVFDGIFNQHLFARKIVIVGEDLGRSSKDYIFTPYSRDIENNMTTMEMHANMLDTLILNSAHIPAPRWLDICLTIIISIITVYVVLSLPPVRGILIIGTSLAVFLLTSYFAFWPFGLWIKLAHPLLAVFICYYFFIPYRLIMENRRSWEYFQKNKLLMQVEELKTNFISMMSHDLKTPLARIQGMAELILRDSTPLSIEQREAVVSIRQSSLDLTKFITSILSFGRIESQGVKLHLHSKDINALISEAVKKCEPLAKEKNIKILTELEPLFSIQLDPDLMIQVFCNLIENAVKYSPNDSRILISSEEMDQKIIVQVADQGMGIPDDELPNIFMKFFRSNNAKASPIKGSGIGLYLAQYFVELHQGRISVESSIGQGSTFTVELPVDPEAKKV